MNAADQIDRTLLELAAVAIGEVPAGYDHRGLLLRGVQEPWNPLEDDGDALRLAVNLGLVVQPVCYDDYDKLFAAVYKYDDCAVEVCSVREPYDNGPYPATRRVIVRAAAEMGNLILDKREQQDEQ